MTKPFTGQNQFYLSITPFTEDKHDCMDGLGRSILFSEQIKICRACLILKTFLSINFSIPHSPPSSSPPGSHPSLTTSPGLQSSPSTASLRAAPPTERLSEFGEPRCTELRAGMVRPPRRDRLPAPPSIVYFFGLTWPLFTDGEETGKTK